MAKTPKRNEQKAAVIAIAEDIGELKAATKFKIAKRTISRYKAQALTDPELALKVVEARKAQTARINEKLSRLRELATDKMIEALEDPTTPKSIVLATLVQMENQAAAKDIADRILGTDEQPALKEVIEAEHE